MVVEAASPNGALSGRGRPSVVPGVGAVRARPVPSVLAASLAVLALGVAGALVPTDAADAQEASRDHPPITYRACPQEDCGLLVRDPAGESRRLTSDGRDRPADWSPDGREIVYVKRETETAEPERGLFVIGADGTGQRQVSGDVAAAPQWSPDGQWIAFLRGEGGTGETTELAVVPPDGSKGHVVTTGIRSFSWGPDGERLAALTTATDQQPGVLRIVSVDGDIQRTISLAAHYPAGQPAWSPDGTTIAYGATDLEQGRFSEDHTYLVSADGTATRQVGAAHDEPHARSWSPGGTRLALGRIYMASTSVVAGEVDIVDARDGSVTTRIAQRDRSLTERLKFYDPVWSADGQRLYMKTVNLPTEPGRWLTVTDPRGNNRTNLIAGGSHYVVGPPVDACPQVAWYEAEPAAFTDRGAISAAHRSNVDCAVHHTIVQGFADNSYRPHVAVRRDQMATFVAETLRTAGVQLPEPREDTFADVPSDSPHAEAIHGLAAAGVVRGGPGNLAEDSYGPGRTVQRDQMASFLLRAAEFATERDLGSQTQHFEDVPPANAHFAAVNGAAEHELTKGVTDSAFRPDAAVSRAQNASFAVRLLSFL